METSEREAGPRTYRGAGSSDAGTRCGGKAFKWRAGACCMLSAARRRSLTRSPCLRTRSRKLSRLELDNDGSS